MARELQPQHTEPHIFFCAPPCIGSLYVLALLQHHKQHALFLSVPKRLIKDTYHFVHLVAYISTIKPTPSLQPHKQQELFSSLPKRSIDNTHRFMHLVVYVSTLTPRSPLQSNEQYVLFSSKKVYHSFVHLVAYIFSILTHRPSFQPHKQDPRRPRGRGEACWRPRERHCWRGWCRNPQNF
jgi:hypothetical protein